MMSDFSGMVCELPHQYQFGCLEKNGSLEGDGSHPRHRNSTLVSARIPWCLVRQGNFSLFHLRKYGVGVTGLRGCCLTQQRVGLLEKVSPPLACHQVAC